MLCFVELAEVDAPQHRCELAGIEFATWEVTFHAAGREIER
jgi:hypothetical protein